MKDNPESDCQEWIELLSMVSDRCLRKAYFIREYMYPKERKHVISEYSKRFGGHAKETIPEPIVVGSHPGGIDLHVPNSIGEENAIAMLEEAIRMIKAFR